MTFQPHKKVKLSNGLTIIHLHTKDNPVSAAHLFIPGGSADETVNSKGLSTLLWSLFMKGTESKNAKKCAEELEALGAYADAGANHDYASISLHAISENFIPTFALAVEALVEPQFNMGEVDKEKNALLASIKAKQESIFTVTNEKCNAALFDKHPYAMPSSGDIQTVSRMKSDHVYKWHQKIFQPNQSILSIASDQSFESLFPFIEKNFGPNTWAPGDISWRKRINTPAAPDTARDLVNESKFEQAFFMMAYPAPPALSRNFATTKILNAVLGGGMSARLFQTLREKQGLAYDVGSFYPSRRFGSGFYLYLGLQKDKIGKAREAMEKEIQRIKTEAVPEQELQEIKSYVKGTYLLGHQTNSQRSHFLGWWEMLGHASHYDEIYVSDIENVTSANILECANTLFSQPPVIVQTIPSANLEKQPTA